MPEIPDARNKCILLDLPAEVRNEICEAVLTGNEAENNVVELLFAKPPTKALQRCCRQTYANVKEMRKEAYRQYWPTTSFVITKIIDYKLANFAEEDLAAVRHLTLRPSVQELVQAHDNPSFELLTDYFEENDRLVFERRADQNWLLRTVNGSPSHTGIDIRNLELSMAPHGFTSVVYQDAAPDASGRVRGGDEGGTGELVVGDSSRRATDLRLHRR